MKILDMKRQGECLFIKVDQFKDNDAQYKSIKPENGQLIVAHSETGHHHVIDIEESKNAQLLIDKTNEFIGKLILDEDTKIKHLRNFDTHKTVNLEKGNYVLRYAREYTPQGLRRVMD